MKKGLYFSLIFILFSNILQAQITAPDADGSDETQYPVFSETDDIYIFCTADSTFGIGALTVSTELEGTKTFLWEKYNKESADFEYFSQESMDGYVSQISNLADGCYRATVTQGETSEVDRAWVFNNWTVVSGYTSDSNCELFILNGEFETAELLYYDLSDNAEIQLSKEIEMEWQQDGDAVSSLLVATIYDPPTEDTNYTLTVSDKFGCTTSATVTYESIVTEAEFTANPTSGEAPLTVTFTNTSENGTSGYYEWFLYRDIYEITDESEDAIEPVDSILIMEYDDSPVYTYEYTGSYKVKLVSKNVSEFYTCTDTFIMEDYIEVDSSVIVVPNVFTPNGDGVNDQLIVKFESLESLEINIYNRWGKRVHHWKSGDVEGFEETWSETVWDGKIGGSYASPGVYYYDVRGYGRDGIKRSKHGFIHLFRGK